MLRKNTVLNIMNTVHRLKFLDFRPKQPNFQIRDKNITANRQNFFIL